MNLLHQLLISAAGVARAFHQRYLCSLSYCQSKATHTLEHMRRSSRGLDAPARLGVAQYSQPKEEKEGGKYCLCLGLLFSDSLQQ